eukprot:Opistho-2@8823
MHGVMQDCWLHDVRERPSFSEIVAAYKGEAKRFSASVRAPPRGSVALLSQREVPARPSTSASAAGNLGDAYEGDMHFVHLVGEEEPGMSCYTDMDLTMTADCRGENYITSPYSRGRHDGNLGDDGFKNTAKSAAAALLNNINEHTNNDATGGLAGNASAYLELGSMPRSVPASSGSAYLEFEGTDQ